jgi:hypothetical protein
VSRQTADADGRPTRQAEGASYRERGRLALSVRAGSVFGNRPESALQLFSSLIVLHNLPPLRVGFATLGTDRVLTLVSMAARTVPEQVKRLSQTLAILKTPFRMLHTIFPFRIGMCASGLMRASCAGLGEGVNIDARATVARQSRDSRPHPLAPAATLGTPRRMGTILSGFRFRHGGRGRGPLLRCRGLVVHAVPLALYAEVLEGAMPLRRQALLERQSQLRQTLEHEAEVPARVVLPSISGEMGEPDVNAALLRFEQFPDFAIDQLAPPQDVLSSPEIGSPRLIGPEEVL